MGEPHDRGDEHIQHLLLCLEVSRGEALEDSEPRVVDEDLHGLGAQALFDHGQLRSVSEIGRDDVDLHAMTAQFGCHDVESLPVAGDKHDVVPASRQSPGKGEPDARGCPGDKCRAHVNLLGIVAKATLGSRASGVVPPSLPRLTP